MPFLHQNKIKKRFLLSLLIIVALFSGLYFWYNKDKGVLAQGQKPINCKKQQEVNLPFGTTFQFGPNELELPIGQATDETQATAKKIIRRLLEIDTAAKEEIEAANPTIEYAGECAISNCETPGCHLDSCTRPCITRDQVTGACIAYGTCTPPCVRPTCGGNACPHKTEMEAKLAEVTAKAEIIKKAYEAINNMFTLRPSPPIGCWTELCPGPPLPQNTNCRTSIEITLDKLEKSRSGDYLGCGNMWIRRELKRRVGLKDCVLRPEDQEAFLKGEKAGKLLLNCKNALSFGLINKESCYGIAACTAAQQDNPGTDPGNCPRAENYYCCE